MHIWHLRYLWSLMIHNLCPIAKVPISMELFQHCSRKVMAEARFIDVVQSLQHVIEVHLKCEGGKEKEVEESESLNVS